MRLKVALWSAMLTIIVGAGAAAAPSMATWQWGRAFRKCTFSHAGYVKSLGCVVYNAAIPGKAGEEDGVGVVETQEIVAPKPFTMAIPSWNASTPDGSYIVVFLKVRADGVWSKWCKLTLYNTKGNPEPRQSCKDGDDIVFSECSAVGVRDPKRADAVRLRFELRSTDGKTYPTLRFVGVNTNDPTPEGMFDKAEPDKSVWGTELDIPYLSQLSVKGGSVWCSPTSVAMVLGYWSKRLNRPDLVVGITDAAAGIRDNALRGTGNWGMNTAFAGEFPGIKAYVDRFSSLSRVEYYIGKGVPVIVSHDYGLLNHWKNSAGHLAVVRGFTKDGDIILNDPWTPADKLDQVRKVFKRADFEACWLGPKGSEGTVYVIYPQWYRL